MKLTIILLGLLNGLYMFIDGLFVLIKGKYIGPEKPGSWANLFYKFEIDVFKLGPLFVLFGICWLSFVLGIATNQSWAYYLGIVMSLLTLWYLPIGTIISLVILILLIGFRVRMGIK